MKKTAVVLFNLGGPDNQPAVKPFLFNLFNDHAIIQLPNPLRFLIARLISSRRAPVAREIYAKMGGGSPILKNTQIQAEALTRRLNAESIDHHFKCFIAMRYWHPFSNETVNQVKDYAPDEVILLPLYPQYSTTTTASSIKDWVENAQRGGLKAPTKMLCCYPKQEGFIHALAGAVRTAYIEARRYGDPRVLFSAHGLPEKIIAQGDPYQAQCEMTVAALRQELNIDGLDSVLCFQSRVGPLQWIKPATDDEVRRAGQDKKPLIVVPVAFVSDHSETLVELDIEYRHLAKDAGVPFYDCVRAVGAAPDFIDGLAQLVDRVRAQEKSCTSEEGTRLCPEAFGQCPLKG